MEIKLLNSRQYQERTGLKRTTLWRKIKRGDIVVLKVSPKKLWFLPPDLTVCGDERHKLIKRFNIKPLVMGKV